MEPVLGVIRDFGRQNIVVAARHENSDDSQQWLGVTLQPVGGVIIHSETRIDPDRQASGNERINRPKPFWLNV
jgi:hypothetical protein